MEQRNQEIINRFDRSWNETENFYQDLYDNYNGFEFVKPYLDFIKSMRKSGEWINFRIGTSVHTLVISRSVEHGLRDDQKEIRIEFLNKSASDFEYEVVMRQGQQIFREYKIRDLNDERLNNLLKTLKRTLID